MRRAKKRKYVSNSGVKIGKFIIGYCGSEMI